MSAPPSTRTNMRLDGNKFQRCQSALSHYRKKPPAGGSKAQMDCDIREYARQARPGDSRYHRRVIPPSWTGPVCLKAGHKPWRLDCLAGHIRFELRNVGANYPFERSRRFPGIKSNSGHRDYSRLSCGVWKTQLGPNARISAGMLARTLVNRKTRGQLLGRACHAI